MDLGLVMQPGCQGQSLSLQCQCPFCSHVSPRSVSTDPESPLVVRIGIHDITINQMETLFYLHGASITNRTTEAHPASVPPVHTQVHYFILCTFVVYPSHGQTLLIASVLPVNVLLISCEFQQCS